MANPYFRRIDSYESIRYLRTKSRFIKNAEVQKNAV